MNKNSPSVTHMKQQPISLEKGVKSENGVSLEKSPKKTKVR